jgi:putative hemolysin
MSLWLDALVIAVCLAGTAIFSSAETAFYRVSRVRIDMDARQGRATSRWIRRLLSNETALVITLVLGLNLCLEFMTHDVETLLIAAGTPKFGIEVWITLVVTPLVFFFGELLPKELARRRPHAVLAVTSPVVIFTRYLFLPVERFMALVTALVSRALSLEPRLFSSGQGREAVLDFLREGKKSGAIPHSAEEMAKNVLTLRTIPVERCMMPWKDVARLDARDPDEDLYALVSRSRHTRLLVVGEKGGVLGYVHQLDVLGAGPGETVLSHLRDVAALRPGTPVDRALARLRASGQRLAIVGTSQTPLGLVTLKDLVEEISGDLSGW